MTDVNHDRSGGGESCCICWSQSRLEVASWLFGATAITFSKFLDAMSRLSYNPMSPRVKYAWSHELCSWHLAATRTKTRSPPSQAPAPALQPRAASCWCPRFGQAQDKPYSRTLLDFAFDPNPASVRFDDFFG